MHSKVLAKVPAITQRTKKLVAFKCVEKCV